MLARLGTDHWNELSEFMFFVEKNRKWLIANMLMVAISYFLLGVVSSFLALPPGYSSPVFPAAGLALGGILLGGRRQTVSVWFGSFALNVWISMQHGHLSSQMLLVAGLIALGASLQGWGAAELIRGRLQQRWRVLENGKDVFWFLLLAGPIACMISATWGNSILLAFGLISFQEVFFDWGVWWIGDTMGIIVFLPWCLAWLLRSSPEWSSRVIKVSLSSFAALLTISVTFLLVSYSEQANIRQHVSNEAEKLVDGITSNLIEYGEVVDSVARLMRVSPKASHADFEQFALPVFKQHGDLHGLSWNRYVEDGQRESFEGQMSHDLGQRFRITERGGASELDRAGVRDHYVPVTYIIPREANRKAIGFDINSEPMRHKALTRAIVTGTGAATEPIQFVQDEKPVKGMLYAVPVYAYSKITQHPYGFAVGIFRIGQMLAAMDHKVLPPGLMFSVVDASLQGSAGIYYQSNNFADTSFPVPLWTKEVRFGGQVWEVSVGATSGYFVSNRPYAAWLWLVAALFLAAFFQYLLLVTTATATVIRRQVNEKTRELREANASLAKEKEKFKLLLETSGDGIHVFDVDGNVVEVNQRFCDMLGYSREELMGMNVAQWDAKFEGAALKEKVAANFRLASVFETAHRRKDGVLIDVEISAKAVHYDGRMVLWNASRDVTERKLTLHQLQQSESEYRHLVDGLPYGVVIHRNGLVLTCNQKAFQLLKVNNPGEIIGQSVIKFVHPDHRELVKSRIAKTMTQHVDADLIEEKLLHVDGSAFDAEVVSMATHFEGEPASLVVFGDISLRKHQEEELRLAATIYQNSSEGMMITDADNRIVAVNPAFSRLTGYQPDEVIGKDPRLLHSGRQSQEFYSDLWHQLEIQGSWQGEIWNRRKNGEIYAEHLYINAVRNEMGQIYRYIALFSDISDQKKKAEIIWQQANFDALTGLPNRRLFHDRLQQAMLKSDRTGEALALMFIDLDHFKEVNDTLGHAKGDRLLQLAADRIRVAIRETDTVARLGGDEITVILPGFSERMHLQRVAQMIVQELSKPFDLGEVEQAYVSASVGIAIHPDDANEITSLLKHADQAMYAAKSSGRNRFSYFTPALQRESMERMELTNELRLAIKRGELEVYYQPILDVANKNIEKAEALIRWNHPVRGLLSPAVFIPLAEESGLIHEIGNWVFGEVVEAANRWQQRYGRSIQVSVNRSPVQFERGNAVESLDRAKQSIIIEITEGLLLRSTSEVKRQLDEFRARGMLIAIDDFGTGYSALSYLKNFDISFLKIDRSFVSGLMEDETDRALAEAIIVMAHRLGIKTIAEGVETKAQERFLSELGCDYLQGFWLSPAVPRHAFESMLDAYTAH